MEFNNSKRGKLHILTNLCISTLVLSTVYGFNLSPKPNIVIKDPQLATKPKVASSYFGFTLNLRPSGIIVGAPRAQSTLKSQQKVNESGAIYKCSLTSKSCVPFVFDPNGNTHPMFNGYTYDSQIKDNQWLGATMDGGTADTDKLVVCAPRFKANIREGYAMHGICYWTQNTLGDKPMKVKRLSPLKSFDLQSKDPKGGATYYFQLSQQGLSAHVTPNDEEILMGAPGINTWKGSVIHYYKKTFKVRPSLNRRNTEGGRISRQIEGDRAMKWYVTDVPNPENWGQANDSYFGYAVDSGYFDSNEPNKLAYAATAPQANEQSGEAYLFNMNAVTINTHVVLHGTQFGEYFGYAILADDFNGDGLTDVIVSAPQHNVGGSYDDGAIYIFINKGMFNFERKLLISPVSGKARFGTTLAKLGDINHDGYNDFAVGAPFANGNGSVYIFLGSKEGVRHNFSQLLQAPTDLVPSPYGGQMFGHGLSKGSDIDANGFNDFAIGAPNAESIYVYRAYPTVSIRATINSLSREIKPDQTKFQVRVCYMISTTSQKIQRQYLAMRIVVDPHVRRVILTRKKSTEISFNASVSTQNECTLFDCEVRFSPADVFKPIELQLHYDVVNGVPESHEFCENCVAVDPAEPKIYTEKIIFRTDCVSEICVADLQLESALNHTYVLGSEHTFSVSYVVTNNGESAYMAQLNVTSSNRMPFARIPSSCKSINDGQLICDLNLCQPIEKGGKDALTVIFDVSGISGQAMVITAQVFSTSEELMPANNIAKDVITLKEFTEIEAIGSSETPDISLEKVSGIAEIINNYEIRSHGPSTVGEIEISFAIPVAYRVMESELLIPIVDVNNITVQATYDNQLIGVDFHQSNSQMITNSVELSTNTLVEETTKFFENSKGMNYNEEDHTVYESVEHNIGDDMILSRSRRETLNPNDIADKYSRSANEDLKGSLPANRTILFKCNNPEMIICVRAIMKVQNFSPEKPITISMKFNVDLEKVHQILTQPLEFFVLLNCLDIIKTGDSDATSYHVTKKIDYNVISKQQFYVTPIWVIILAVLGGLLALALATYGMYKAGFFKRAKKEEMEKILHEDQANGVEEIDDHHADNQE